MSSRMPISLPARIVQPKIVKEGSMFGKKDNAQPEEAFDCVVSECRGDNTRAERPLPPAMSRWTRCVPPPAGAADPGPVERRV